MKSRYFLAHHPTRFVVEERVIELERQLTATQAALGATQAELLAIRHSKAWRLVSPFFGLKKKVRSWLEGLKQSRIQAKAPKVTVVIPIYDRVDVLRESIESILNQTLQDFELLLICDGSPEATMAVVESYRKHPKVRIFHYPDNSGNAVRGRNRAIREARGQYLAFQDSDDVADPGRLERSVRTMERYGADVVYGAWRPKLEDPSRAPHLTDGQVVQSPECDYAKLQEVCVPCQSTVMARVAALKDVGGLNPHLRYLEDYELWLRLAHFGYKFKANSEVMTELRLHPGNLELQHQADFPAWREKIEPLHRVKLPWKPRVAYLIPGVGISGGTAIVCQHANRLRARGFDVLLLDVLEQNHSLEWFPDLQVEVVPLSQHPANIDIAIATGWQTVDPLDTLEAKRKLYFVQSDESRFTEDPQHKESIRQSYTRPYEFFTEARWIQAWLKSEFGKDAVYAPNGLDPQIIHPTEPLEPKSDRIRVLLEGPVGIPFKGMADAFAAVQDLDCEIWCVSSYGVPKPSLRCDRFFKAVPMTEMKRIYSSCDILLKMSRVEGFFGPPLEMMACGGTTVVAKVTGYDEYIIDGVNALVVEPRDVEGAREAVQRLIADPDLRQRLIVGGQKTATEWPWEPTIETLENWFLQTPARS